jgi:hypothetical protein
MEGSSCHEVNSTDSTHVFYWTKVQLQKSRHKTSTRPCGACETFYENTYCRIHHSHGHERVLTPLGLLIRSEVQVWKRRQKRQLDVITEETGREPGCGTRAWRRPGQFYSFHFHRNSTRNCLKSSSPTASGRMTTLRACSLRRDFAGFRGFNSSTVK